MSDLPTLPEAVDRLSLSALETRYGIKTGALYERFKVLGIQRKGSGRPAYLSREQTALMDALHLHLRQGGRFADFPHKVQQHAGEQAEVQQHAGERVEVQQNSGERAHDLEPALPGQPLRALSASVSTFLRADVLAVVSGVLIKVGSTIFPPPLAPAKRGLELAYLRELEEAYRSGWLLSTANLANLLGLSSQTVASYGHNFEDAGFTFSRVGKRKGGQLAWQVGKPNSVAVTPLD